MAPHSSTLACKIPWTEEPGGLQSMGSQRVERATEQLHFHFSLSCIGEGMATHSSSLAWRIPGIGKPGRLLSVWLHTGHHPEPLSVLTGPVTLGGAQQLLLGKTSMHTCV